MGATKTYVYRRGAKNSRVVNHEGRKTGRRKTTEIAAEKNSEEEDLN
jgi:hypothetical protein